MNGKITVITAILATTLLLVSTSHAYAALSPTSKILSISPTSVPNIHSVIFQVCASDSVNMRAPEVILKSLKEVKSVSLSKSVAKGTCTTSAAQLGAFDPGNIKIKVVDKSKLNTLVDQAEQKLIKTKSAIAKANDQLDSLLLELPGNTPKKASDVSKVSEITSQLSELRKELKDARMEYYRLLYVLQAS